MVTRATIIAEFSKKPDRSNGQEKNALAKLLLRNKIESPARVYTYSGST